jgi:serine/threonine protein kinase
MEGTKVFTADILKNYRQFTGTFLYAAPERFDSRGFWSVRVKNRGRGDSLEAAVQGVDHRADLYSLGVILFELLTGVLPFKEYSVRGVVRFHRSFKAWPSPRVFNPALPVDLEEIILRLLCRNPSDRYATPAELGEAIKKAKLL